jgi:uncharacterized protein (DUF1501 family)
MEHKQFSVQTRREFLRQAACAAVGTAALTSAIRDLRFMNAAVAQTGINDYKALVCVFLSGGNDSNNLIVPTENTEYNNYASIRTPVLAIPQASLLGIAPQNPDGRQYGLHPACTQLRDLFTEGKLALLFNTGTLVYPLTRAQYQATGSKKPPQLFSHADQITQWQTSIPDRPPLTGWGGRCADLLNSAQPANAAISLSVSLAGANTFEVGNTVSQYAVSTSGAIALTGVSGARLTALTNILGLSYSNMQAQAYAGVAGHSIATGQALNSAIDQYADILEKKSDGVTQGTWVWQNELTGIYPNGQTGGFPNTTLGKQLKMAARMIAARSTLNMARQIFFCSVSGYDLHTGQTKLVSPNTFDPTQGAHANLLGEVSQCLLAFQRAMEQLTISNKVTAFTASDFGRTFPGNGLGSDHGWGSHHMILGGAVNGGRIYGKFPTLAINGPDDTNTGRWIPTTAIDQYFATLATWFGVDPGKLATVFPNLGRFATPNLGFV